LTIPAIWGTARLVQSGTPISSINGTLQVPRADVWLALAHICESRVARDTLARGFTAPEVFAAKADAGT